MCHKCTLSHPSACCNACAFTLPCQVYSIPHFYCFIQNPRMQYAPYFYQWYTLPSTRSSMMLSRCRRYGIFTRILVTQLGAVRYISIDKIKFLMQMNTKLFEQIWIVDLNSA
ncbi:unnamed protein product [Albugo candida]|uniref:Uncharacterized protein n=1 Tax=Albugo candida TaxID=65357 RepID=A0A024GA48_9STRA|nr:unnamed protein product [Albugo candida]|eukprot:CCI43534.1 unnamed protein product [Albugo candida]